MKNPDPSIVEVTYHERPGFKVSNNRRYNNNHLAKCTKAKTANEFLKKGMWYTFSMLPNGFKIRIPGLQDKKLLRADNVGHVCVSGVEPGFYDIVEQTEDYIIAKKQSK